MAVARPPFARPLCADYKVEPPRRDTPSIACRAWRQRPCRAAQRVDDSQIPDEIEISLDQKNCRALTAHRGLIVKQSPKSVGI